MGKNTQEDMQIRDVMREIVERIELLCVLKAPLGCMRLTKRDSALRLQECGAVSSEHQRLGPAENSTRK